MKRKQVMAMLLALSMVAANVVTAPVEPMQAFLWQAEWEVLVINSILQDQRFAKI